MGKRTRRHSGSSRPSAPRWGARSGVGVVGLLLGLVIVAAALAWSPPAPKPQVKTVAGVSETRRATEQRWFSSTSPWNTPVGAAGVLPRSASWVGALYNAVGGINMNYQAWTPTVFVADASTPRGPVRLDNGWVMEDVPLPAGLHASGDSDAHAVIIDSARGREYDFFALSGGSGAWSAHAGIVFRLDGSGWWNGGYSSGGVSGPVGCACVERGAGWRVDPSVGGAGGCDSACVGVCCAEGADRAGGVSGDDVGWFGWVGCDADGVAVAAGSVGGCGESGSGAG